MKKTAVIYKTKYGSTKKYAEWIAQNLSCDIFDAREVKVNDLLKYDVIIFGGGLYASGIIGIQTITKNYSKLKDKEIIIFTCGITNPEDKEQFELVLIRNLTEEMRKNCQIYHFRGAIDYQKLKLFHKAIIAMLAKMVKKIDDDKKTDKDKLMLEIYGKHVDFTDENYIKPLIEYVRNL